MPDCQVLDCSDSFDVEDDRTVAKDGAATDGGLIPLSRPAGVHDHIDTCCSCISEITTCSTQKTAKLLGGKYCVEKCCQDLQMTRRWYKMGRLCGYEQKVEKRRNRFFDHQCATCIWMERTLPVPGSNDPVCVSIREPGCKKQQPSAQNTRLSHVNLQCRAACAVPGNGSSLK